ncbi:unnamed protein product [Vitrella brassicaformis CCMP3155]|uniref:EF-hand domain-containing protein n=3 Tax=Vitrella brassicaformis TaxID=1169539 RepID=A0A0G4E9Y4_VITBC|nr:unnamed protein product [Vitrella brassicaformis CCMP3155]|eukprot:CEL92255.1 unnamed protein product [Vitrella brassicaformis CCMP3155]
MSGEYDNDFEDDIPEDIAEVWDDSADEGDLEGDMWEIYGRPAPPTHGRPVSAHPGRHDVQVSGGEHDATSTSFYIVLIQPSVYPPPSQPPPVPPSAPLPSPTAYAAPAMGPAPPPYSPQATYSLTAADEQPYPAQQQQPLYQMPLHPPPLATQPSEPYHPMPEAPMTFRKEATQSYEDVGARRRAGEVDRHDEGRDRDGEPQYDVPARGRGEQDMASQFERAQAMAQQQGVIRPRETPAVSAAVSPVAAPQPPSAAPPLSLVELRDVLVRRFGTLDKAFLRMDENFDDRLTRLEFCRSLQRLDLDRDIDDAAASSLFRELDVKQNGVVTFDELRRGISRAVKAEPPAAQAAAEAPPVRETRIMTHSQGVSWLRGLRRRILQRHPTIEAAMQHLQTKTRLQPSAPIDGTQWSGLLPHLYFPSLDQVPEAEWDRDALCWAVISLLSEMRRRQAVPRCFEPLRSALAQRGSEGSVSVNEVRWALWAHREAAGDRISEGSAATSLRRFKYSLSTLTTSEPSSVLERTAQDFGYGVDDPMPIEGLQRLSIALFKRGDADVADLMAALDDSRSGLVTVDQLVQAMRRTSAILPQGTALEALREAILVRFFSLDEAFRMLYAGTDVQPRSPVSPATISRALQLWGVRVEMLHIDTHGTSPADDLFESLAGGSAPRQTQIASAKAASVPTNGRRGDDSGRRASRYTYVYRPADAGWAAIGDWGELHDLLDLQLKGDSHSRVQAVFPDPKSEESAVIVCLRRRLLDRFGTLQKAFDSLDTSPATVSSAEIDRWLRRCNVFARTTDSCFSTVFRALDVEGKGELTRDQARHLIACAQWASSFSSETSFDLERRPSVEERAALVNKLRDLVLQHYASLRDAFEAAERAHVRTSTYGGAPPKTTGTKLGLGDVVDRLMLMGISIGDAMTLFSLIDSKRDNCITADELQTALRKKRPERASSRERLLSAPTPFAAVLRIFNQRVMLPFAQSHPDWAIAMRVDYGKLVTRFALCLDEHYGSRVMSALEDALSTVMRAEVTPTTLLSSNLLAQAFAMLTVGVDASSLFMDMEALVDVEGASEADLRSVVARLIFILVDEEQDGVITLEQVMDLLQQAPLDTDAVKPRQEALAPPPPSAPQIRVQPPQEMAAPQPPQQSTSMSGSPDDVQSLSAIESDEDSERREAMQEFRGRLIECYGSVKSAFDHLDENGSRTLDREEFLRLCREIRVSSISGQKLFGYLDRDGSNTIALRELRKALHDLAPEREVPPHPQPQPPPISEPSPPAIQPPIPPTPVPPAPLPDVGTDILLGGILAGSSVLWVVRMRLILHARRHGEREEAAIRRFSQECEEAEKEKATAQWNEADLMDFLRTRTPAILEGPIVAHLLTKVGAASPLALRDCLLAANNTAVSKLRGEIELAQLSSSRMSPRVGEESSAEVVREWLRVHLGPSRELTRTSWLSMTESLLSDPTRDMMSDSASDTKSLMQVASGLFTMALLDQSSATQRHGRPDTAGIDAAVRALSCELPFQILEASMKMRRLQLQVPLVSSPSAVLFKNISTLEEAVRASPLSSTFSKEETQSFFDYARDLGQPSVTWQGFQGALDLPLTYAALHALLTNLSLPYSLKQLHGLLTASFQPPMPVDAIQSHVQAIIGRSPDVAAFLPDREGPDAIASAASKHLKALGTHLRQPDIRDGFGLLGVMSSQTVRGVRELLLSAQRDLLEQDQMTLSQAMGQTAARRGMATPSGDALMTREIASLWMELGFDFEAFEIRAMQQYLDPSCSGWISTHLLDALVPAPSSLPPAPPRTPSPPFQVVPPPRQPADAAHTLPSPHFGEQPDWQVRGQAAVIWLCRQIKTRVPSVEGAIAPFQMQVQAEVSPERHAAAAATLSSRMMAADQLQEVLRSYFSISVGVDQEATRKVQDAVAFLQIGGRAADGRSEYDRYIDLAVFEQYLRDAYEDALRALRPLAQHFDGWSFARTLEACEQHAISQPSSPQRMLRADGLHRLSSHHKAEIHLSDCSEIVAFLCRTTGGCRDQVPAEKFAFTLRRVAAQLRLEQQMDAEIHRVVFRHFDTNNDGAIDSSELRLALLSLGCEVPQWEVERLIAAADRDGNGRLDAAEIRALMTPYVQQALKQDQDFYQQAREAFDAADLDKNGRLTREELSTALKRCNVSLTDAETSAIFNAADRDRNATVDIDEFMSLIQEEEARDTEAVQDVATAAALLKFSHSRRLRLDAYVGALVGLPPHFRRLPAVPRPSALPPTAASDSSGLLTAHPLIHTHLFPNRIVPKAERRGLCRGKPKEKSKRRDVGVFVGLVLESMRGVPSPFRDVEGRPVAEPIDGTWQVCGRQLRITVYNEHTRQYQSGSCVFGASVSPQSPDTWSFRSSGASGRTDDSMAILHLPSTGEDRRLIDCCSLLFEASLRVVKHLLKPAIPAAPAPDRPADHNGGSSPLPVQIACGWAKLPLSSLPLSRAGAGKAPSSPQQLQQQKHEISLQGGTVEHTVGLDAQSIPRLQGSQRRGLSVLLPVGAVGGQVTASATTGSPHAPLLKSTLTVDAVPEARLGAEAMASLAAITLPPFGVIPRVVLPLMHQFHLAWCHSVAEHSGAAPPPNLNSTRASLGLTSSVSPTATRKARQQQQQAAVPQGPLLPMGGFVAPVGGPSGLRMLPSVLADPDVRQTIVGAWKQRLASLPKPQQSDPASLRELFDDVCAKMWVLLSRPDNLTEGTPSHFQPSVSDSPSPQRSLRRGSQGQVTIEASSAMGLVAAGSPQEIKEWVGRHALGGASFRPLDVCEVQTHEMQVALHP